MNLPGVRWGSPEVVNGGAPVGVVTTRCAGCLKLFVSGEPVVARMIGPCKVGLYAHPVCVEKVEARCA